MSDEELAKVADGLSQGQEKVTAALAAIADIFASRGSLQQIAVLVVAQEKAGKAAKTLQEGVLIPAVLHGTSSATVQTADGKYTVSASKTAGTSKQVVDMTKLVHAHPEVLTACEAKGLVTVKNNAESVKTAVETIGQTEVDSFTSVKTTEDRFTAKIVDLTADD